MEVQPLQDSLPPRHQVESDESEDEDAYPAVSSYTRPPPSKPIVHLRWNGLAQARPNLLVALYEAGRYWTQGVQLEEIQGDIILNDTVIGNIYTPPWTDTLVLVIDSRLPLYTIHAIASTIVLSTAPKSICLIDSYSVPLYVSITSSTSIRCLQTHTKTRLTTKTEAFSPPNIIQGLAAIFVSLAEFRKLPATLLLLPSSYMIPPAPPNIISRTFGPSIGEEWGSKIMEDLHRDVCTTLGSHSVWKYDSDDKSFGRTVKSRKGDIGEGGMYI